MSQSQQKFVRRGPGRPRHDGQLPRGARWEIVGAEAAPAITREPQTPRLSVPTAGGPTTISHLTRVNTRKALHAVAQLSSTPSTEDLRVLMRKLVCLRNEMRIATLGENAVDASWTRLTAEWQPNREQTWQVIRSILAQFAGVSAAETRGPVIAGTPTA